MKPALWLAELTLNELRAEGSALRQRVSKGERLDQWPRLPPAVKQEPVVRVPEHFVMIRRAFAALGGLTVQSPPTIEILRFTLPIVMVSLSCAKRHRARQRGCFRATPRRIFVLWVRLEEQSWLMNLS